MARFGLLGETLRHSFSPLIHSMLGSYDYPLFEKKPEQLRDFLESGDFDGLNVTIPYKKAVIPYCSELSDTARSIGSVNTIVRLPDGRLRGDNTDYYGFEYMLESGGVNVRGRKALILGSGGASVTAQAVLRDLGAAAVIVVSRSGETTYSKLDIHRDAALIVNTTPVGMYPDVGLSAVEVSDFPQLEAVVDVIYNPAKTKLLLDAEDMGIPAIGGLPMLVAQAKKAGELFTGSAIDDKCIGRITDCISAKTRSIAIIGMPGSGKTTIGRALASLTGRRFYDTDDMVTEAAGKPIPDIFAQDGEAAFRALESEALACASCESGCVIATGGGIITVPSNRRLLRQNSAVVFLERATDELPTEGRPLSQSLGVDILHRQRLPMYTAWSDFRITAHGIDETAADIKEHFGL